MPNREFIPEENHDNSEALQLVAQPMQTFLDDGKVKRIRPVICAVVGEHSGHCFGMDIAKEDESIFDLAGQVLVKSLAAARLPGHVRVQVRDAELATILKRRSDLADTEFEVVDKLDAVDSMLAEMQRDLFPQAVAPLLGQPGMVVERLHAFADGCAIFYSARPWRHLRDDDLIEVQSPQSPPGMHCASILGAGGEVMGIGFFPDVAAHERLLNSEAPPKTIGKGQRWALMFNAPDELPSGDAELWETHGLRVAADEMVPLLLRYRGVSKVDRPDGATMTFVEGLCRAVAATTESEIDSGRWEKTVQTFDGTVVYRLGIPHLLLPASAAKEKPLTRASMERSMQQMMRIIEQSGAKSIEEMSAVLNAKVNSGVLPKGEPPSSGKGRAMELCYDAQEQRSRRQLQLLREALRLDPDCAEAYVGLAERESDPVEAEKLYRQGVEAGRRSLGERAFNDPKYPFWGALESRPFMRALSGVAETLEMQGKLSEASEVLAEMLKLNPGDNQGIRYRYILLLLMVGRLEAAKALIESKEYRSDICVLWDLAGAIIAFKQRRSMDADRLLRQATKRNRFVVPMLLDRESMPEELGSGWSPGTESEAAMVADLLENLFEQDANAAEWLAKSYASARKLSRQNKTKNKRDRR